MGTKERERGMRATLSTELSGKDPTLDHLLVLGALNEALYSFEQLRLKPLSK